jgi:hypothetical protein
MPTQDTNWSDANQATEAIIRHLERLPEQELRHLDDSLLFQIDHMARRIEYAEVRT